MTCPHDYYWYPKEGGSPNEQGWRCVVCDERPGEPPGFSPHLDREETYRKVSGILMDLCDDGFIYVSSGTAGDGMTVHVAEKCHETGVYDQYTIIRLLMESCDGHADYWKRISEGVISGNDIRERCFCGALSVWWSSQGGREKRGCNNHGHDDVPWKEPDEAVL